MEEAPPPRKPKQLWLFPPPKPLNERIGPAFFRALPREPGVYFLFNAEGLLLYIGKAKSLRERLNSYRYVHPDRDSRKTWRLVNEVRRIEFQTCESHRQALLLESRLLREHRPRFNRANVWPWSAVYIGLQEGDDLIRLQVSRELNEEFEWFGAFKAFAIYSFSALQRSLRYIADPAQAPLGWFDWDCGRSFEVPSQRIDRPALRAFLEGHSNRFLENIESARATDCIADLAHQNLVLNDLILLEEFYEKGPHRNRLIKNRGQLVKPEELVDWLAEQSA